MQEEPLAGRDPDDAFDMLLRSEMHWEAPPELSARLFALVPGGLGLLPTPLVKAQPKLWVRVLTLALTILALIVSFVIAIQVYGSLASELGFTTWWEQLQALPTLATGWFFDTVPGAGVVVAVLGSVRDQLHWLLAALLLWVALDGWTPSFTRRRVTS
jgi:hypothetical protein